MLDTTIKRERHRHIPLLWQTVSRLAATTEMYKTKHRGLLGFSMAYEEETCTLDINGYYGDAAAAFVGDRRLIAAAAQENSVFRTCRVINFYPF